MQRTASRLVMTLALLGLALFPARAAIAAGSVEMQVEHLVRQAMSEYNTAMRDGDSASFLKYFASNATRVSPLSRHSGRNELARYFDAEFKAFEASLQVNKMFVQGNSAAVVFTWDAVNRTSGEALRIDMVGLFEVGPSGQFNSATYYFDSAKAGALAALGR